MHLLKTSDAFSFLASGIGREPFMAVFQSFFDESGKHKDHPVVTFSGVCASRLQLDKFDDSWKAWLRHYDLKSLHMKEASRLSQNISTKIPRQTIEERTESLKPFADCINDHLELGLIQAMDVKGFNALSEKAKIGLGSPDDPYYITFARGILRLVEYVRTNNDAVSLVCDDDEQTAWDCYRHYRGVKKAHDEADRKLVHLGFADDEYFPALQAADFVAFLSRHEARSRFYNQTNLFGELYKYLLASSDKKVMTWEYMFADEATIRELGEGLEKDED